MIVVVMVGGLMAGCGPENSPIGSVSHRESMSPTERWKLQDTDSGVIANDTLSPCSWYISQDSGQKPTPLVKGCMDAPNISVR